MTSAILADLTEKEWQAQVTQLAKQTGWRGAYHTYDSRRSSSGFPDLVLVRDRVVYLELKREKGKLSPAQRHWVGWLLSAGAEVYVVRPRDLEALGVILGATSKLRASSLPVALHDATCVEAMPGGLEAVA